MLDRSPLVRYWRLMEGHEKRVVIVYPFIIAAVLTWAAYEGDTESCVNYCVDVVPVVASIFIGFLGTMIVASLSKDGVFERMRSTDADGKAEGHSAYHLFFTGVCANFASGMALLLVTLLIGLINGSFEMSNKTYAIELFAILFLLLSTSRSFINNINRIYHATVYDDPRSDLPNDIQAKSPDWTKRCR